LVNMPAGPMGKGLMLLELLDSFNRLWCYKEILN